MKKIAVVLTLSVTFCFVLASVVQATDTSAGRNWAKKNMKNKLRATSIPTWQITKNGKAVSVPWVDATNPRFAIYDPYTPENKADDVVLDKETGLVWARSPSTAYPTLESWYGAISEAYNKVLGGRMGWRLPTIEELASLVDPSNVPSLPTGHPFINVQSYMYWSSTTYAYNTPYACYVHFGGGVVSASDKSDSDCYVWCVRGGQGYDGY